MSYYYFGDFDQGIGDSGNPYHGYPTELSSYNPYNSDTTIPLTTNNVVNDVLLMNGLSKDNVDRKSLTQDFTFQGGPGSAIFPYVAGGTAGFFNAFGIGAGRVSELGSPEVRYILLPNSTATLPPYSTPANPDTYVVGSLALPIPGTSTVPATFTNTDAKGTPIVAVDRLPYEITESAGVLYSPFVLPNAWKYDEAAGA